VLRSTDGGTTRLPLTAGGLPWASFTGNCNEIVITATDSATYYLAFQISSGTVTYRVGQ